MKVLYLEKCFQKNNNKKKIVYQQLIETTPTEQTSIIYPRRFRLKK